MSICLGNSNKPVGKLAHALLSSERTLLSVTMIVGMYDSIKL